MFVSVQYVSFRLGFINNSFFLPLTIETINKVKILFNGTLPVTTPALTEIFHREKANVSKTYLNKYNACSVTHQII